jgi:hypothetical protein
VATVVATGLCWAGVSVVTASINPAPSPSIPARAVHSALSPPPSAPHRSDDALFGGSLAAALPSVAPVAATAPTGTAAGGTSFAGEVASSHPTATIGDPPPSVVPAHQASDPPPSVASHRVHDGGASGTHDGAGDPPAPSSTTASSPQSGQAGSNPSIATFTTDGGIVTVSCQGSTISLVSASPADGYTLAVRESGPAWVGVNFRSATGGREVNATCKGGAPVEVIDHDGAAWPRPNQRETSPNP